MKLLSVYLSLYVYMFNTYISGHYTYRVSMSYSKLRVMIRNDISFFGGSKGKWHESLQRSYLHSWNCVENSSERERLSIESVLWPWAETVDEASYNKNKRARCPEGFTYIYIKMLWRKINVFLLAVKIQASSNYEGWTLYFQTPERGGKNPSSWTNASWCLWM